MRRAVLAFLCGLATACSHGFDRPQGRARNVVLITVDTLRADHVGVYGYRRASTTNIDALAATGVRFDRAYAAAPITLPSHATILSGRYPPGHGARDNGIRMSADIPTIATVLKARGFSTAAFVAAFPLDHQFGLARGFDVYSDHMPRLPDGRLADERPASQVVDEAIAWLRTKDQGPRTKDQSFIWVHLFEPHAPYAGDLSRPAVDRYDEEIGRADREIGRLLDALGPARSDTLIVFAGDHGEAFGEHGEIAHSIFVYDTTLRVPLIVSPPAALASNAPVIAGDAVTLADIAPTIAHAVGAELNGVDGIDLTPAFTAGRLPQRELYAESFAPLVEFGWAPLRAIRAESWKFIAAPQTELYDVSRDEGEQHNLIAATSGGSRAGEAEARNADASAYRAVAERLNEHVGRYSGTALPRTIAAAIDPGAAERLRALGYSAGSRQGDGSTARPDPKDRRELAARIAQVTSGELTGAALLSALEDIVRQDPRNGQAHLRLGVARAQMGNCARAEPELSVAIASGLPSADAYLSLATCRGRRNDLQGAADALAQAQRLEPDSPAVVANVGILQAVRGDAPAAIGSLTRALAMDPDLHEARFNLALVYARSGRRADAAAAANDLLARLPAGAPERAEVERLLRALR